MPRKAHFHGINAGMLDPTGHGMIDEATKGLEGQQYGQASYKRGLKTEQTCNIENARKASIDIKEHRTYS